MTTLNGVSFFVGRHPTLDGFNIVLDARDDPGAATTHVGQNLEARIADSQVLAMIGPFDEAAARAQIPIANRAHLALVSVTTSSRCLTKEPFLPASLNPRTNRDSARRQACPAPTELRPTGLNNYFRLAATDELQGPAAADYAEGACTCSGSRCLPTARPTARRWPTASGPGSSGSAGPSSPRGHELHQSPST